MREIQTPIHLLNRYKETAWLLEFCNNFSSSQETEPIAIKGMIRGLDSIFIAATSLNINTKAQLIIARTREEAYYIYSDIKNLLAKSVHLYSHIEHSDLDPTKVALSQISRREIVTHLKDSPHLHAQIIVTYPEAITKRDITYEESQNHILNLKTDTDIAPSGLEQHLLREGFIKKDFVYSPGEYAIRGGIFDIFSFSTQTPYRIEFSSNKIAEIRLFNPESQCSSQIVDKIDILCKINSNSNSGTYTSIFDLLPPGSIVWIKDYDLTLSLIERAQDLNDKTSEPIDLFKESIKKHKIIDFGSHPYLSPNKQLKYNAAKQINFKQNIPFFLESVQENIDKGMDIVIAAESQLQIDHIKDIFLTNNRPLDNINFLQIGLSDAYIDNEANVATYTDHQIFDRFYRPKSEPKYSKNKALVLRDLQNLEIGDYIVHTDFGVGKFAGLAKTSTSGNQKETIRLVYRDNDTIYLGLQSLHKISKYISKDGLQPKLSKLGTTIWDQKKQKIKSRVKDIAKNLISLYCKRRESPGFAFNTDSVKQVELEASFMYEDTVDQALATKAIKEDMQSPYPMDRLVCGDVGFGKTELAIRAAFKAVESKKQVAVLVPTTILALQHYNSFSSRLSKFGIAIDYLNRFRSPKETKTILDKLTTGKIDIIIGTHKILSKDVSFYDLGLLVVDEEQKFGVSAKERIKQLKLNLDILTLTATPIPRTMHFSLMGARDLTLINTPPENRKPIQTSVVQFHKNTIKDAINLELQRQGQVIVVHNQISTIPELASTIKSIVPNCTIDTVHAKMPPENIEKTIISFIEKKTDVLLATSIIESGIDIPNANTLIVNDAHKFGLSDLHQMRGRVGRSSEQAYCYLIAPPIYELSSVAQRRLNTLEEFSDLGDGFKIAMKDLDIRGAGDLLGAEQSGFIAEVGFETYCQILDEAVSELKDNEFSTTFAKHNHAEYTKKTFDCSLEYDLEAFIPESFVSNSSERIMLYIRLDGIKDESSLQKFIGELTDRFGHIPQQVHDLIDLLRLRWLAQNLGIVSLSLLKNSMKCVFHNKYFEDNDKFNKIVKFMQKNSTTSSIKTTEKEFIVHVNNVPNILSAKEKINSFFI